MSKSRHATVQCEVDVVVVGGGAAGLWTLDRLLRNGYRAVLLESQGLGSGQTLASQGIIHGGLKYSLDGLLTTSAHHISDMPGVWRDALSGSIQPDLSRVALRSDGCYLWRTDNFSSRLGMLGAQLSLKVKPESIPQTSRPSVLKNVPGQVSWMPEQVISPGSFLQGLARRCAGQLLDISQSEVTWSVSERGHVTQIELQPHGGTNGDSQPPQHLTLVPRFVIFAAGAGNEELRHKIGLSSPCMQRRPLHMVVVKGTPGAELPMFQGHCVDGSKTRVTITSESVPGHQSPDEDVVWQLGGQIAEQGVSKSREELIVHAARELSSVLPGMDFSRTLWGTYRVDRAEGLTAHGGRPEKPVILYDHNVITVWPTKLAFAPSVAEEIVATICEQMGHPHRHHDQSAQQTTRFEKALSEWPKPPVAAPPWETIDLWTAWPLSTQEPIQRRQAG